MCVCVCVCRRCGPSSVELVAAPSPVSGVCVCVCACRRCGPSIGPPSPCCTSRRPCASSAFPSPPPGGRWRTPSTRRDSASSATRRARPALRPGEGAAVPHLIIIYGQFSTYSMLLSMVSLPRIRATDLC